MSIFLLIFPTSLIRTGTADQGSLIVHDWHTVYYPKEVEIRRGLMSPFVVTVLMWHHSYLSFQSQNLSLVEFVVCFWENQKRNLEFLKKSVVQPLLSQLLLPSVGERQLYISSCCCFWNSQKSAVCFQNKAYIPILLYLAGPLSDINLLGLSPGVINCFSAGIYSLWTLKKWRK